MVTTTAVVFIISILSICNDHELAARGVVFHCAMSLDDVFESEYTPKLDLDATGLNLTLELLQWRVHEIAGLAGIAGKVDSRGDGLHRR